MAGGRSLSGSPGIDTAQASPQPSQPAANLQVASIAPDTASRGEAGGGYVVQLASFRSEADALGDYQRLKSRHPQLVSSLGSRVTEASLGQSGSFYRLGIGPLSDRGTATKLCHALIAAGEKDCLVRRQ
jgi:cell division septation protein DedD